MAILNYDEKTYEETIKEGFTIVDFYGEGCGPCEALSDVLDELNFEMPFIDIIKVSTDENKKMAKEHRIMAVPTIKFIKDGEEVKSEVGFMSLEKIKEIIADNIY